jgi:hypothetical protein
MSPTDVILGSAASATTLVAMSRSVSIPTSCSSSVIGSEPMSSSRISRAARHLDLVRPGRAGRSAPSSELRASAKSFSHTPTQTQRAAVKRGNRGTLNTTAGERPPAITRVPGLRAQRRAAARRPRGSGDRGRAAGPARLSQRSSGRDESPDAAGDQPRLAAVDLVRVCRSSLPAVTSLRSKPARRKLTAALVAAEVG